ncbi:hypothetical protein CPB83DRAFT_895816 [Crepidotus variabilis]|uniref:Uncharacterized protein n=1 Tax=Crepidotus variabilis TaxID=179855 RepID=A0A9P6JNH0_9AGAR|nr:hypothetical protein CPB83DRAFT_895816 [Crepidotus variabilis]
MPRFDILRLLGTPPKFDLAHKYVTSPFFRSPFILAAIRLSIAVFTLVTLIVVLVWEATKLNEGGSFFSYFTFLSYIGICSYYWASGTQTLAYALKWRRSGAGVGYPLQRWPRILQALHVVLQSSVVNFPIIVTVVFWSLLSGPDTLSTTFFAYENISVHALNTVFLLIEVFLTNSPPAPWLTLVFNILFLAGYLGVAYITHATQGFYTYSFLNTSVEGAKTAAYIIGILIGEIIVFVLVRGVVVLRERWAVKSGRVMDVGSDVSSDKAASSEGLGDMDDDWEEVRMPDNYAQRSPSKHVDA